MNFLKISIGIFLALAVSRFVPHPPNFTSLIALSFYIPVLFGIKFLPMLLVSFIITDFIIGFHEVAFFTWGSVILIGLFAKFFVTSISTRISAALLGACLFYLITNFGVWSLGSYGYTFEGLIACYVLAIPFFAYSLISTLIFSVIIETGLRFFNLQNFIKT
jgi:hypothetical protein